jgi:hypothetical protein
MRSPVRNPMRTGELPVTACAAAFITAQPSAANRRHFRNAPVDDASVWDGNWAWSLPLILVTVIFHVIGLVFINQRVVRARRFLHKGRGSLAVFSMILGAATLVAILLHAIEAGIWATVYKTLGALPDGKSAVLYSLSAMTTYGHEHFDLANHWQLMGALEALNGMILFGLTTAFLYGMIRELLTQRSAQDVAP